MRGVSEKAAVSEGPSPVASEAAAVLRDRQPRMKLGRNSALVEAIRGQ
jgi:hypothetical protein